MKDFAGHSEYLAKVRHCAAMLHQAESPTVRGVNVRIPDSVINEVDGLAEKMSWSRNRTFEFLLRAGVEAFAAQEE